MFNPRFAELLSLLADQQRQGVAFTDLLETLCVRNEYSGCDDQSFLDH